MTPTAAVLKNVSRAGHVRRTLGRWLSLRCHRWSWPETTYADSGVFQLLAACQNVLLGDLHLQRLCTASPKHLQTGTACSCMTLA